MIRLSFRLGSVVGAFPCQRRRPISSPSRHMEGKIVAWAQFTNTMKCDAHAANSIELEKRRTVGKGTKDRRRLTYPTEHGLISVETEGAATYDACEMPGISSAI